VRNDIRAVLSILAAALALAAGCKQQSREEAEPTPATAPSAAPAAAAPSAAPAEPTPPPIDIPPPVQPNVPAAAPVGSTAGKKAAPESIKTCCAALHKEATTAADKSLYTTAAGTCDAIEKLVAAGTTKKAAALTQLRAGLKGAKLPPGCD
jgi:hypothetical protein